MLARMWGKRTLSTIGGNINLVQPMKNHRRFLKKLKIDLPQDPTVPFPK
jgi:hypothetical protein